MALIKNKQKVSILIGVSDAQEGNHWHGRCQTSRFDCPHLTPSCGELTGKAPIVSLVIIARLLQRQSGPNLRQRVDGGGAPCTPPSW